MHTSSIARKAVLSAVGVTAYVALLVLFMNNGQRILGPQPGVLMGMLMLLVFIISACVTGSLVLLRPALWYVDGKKRDALRLLAYTVVALVVVALIVATGLFIRR